MTERLEKAIERVRTLPPDQPDEFARVLLRLAGGDGDGDGDGDEPIYQLTQEERTSFVKSRAQAALDKFANDEEVHAVWAKYGL